MALTVEQRVQLARIVSVGLTVKGLRTQEEREKELLRLVVLPPVAQNNELKTLVTAVKGVLQNQQADLPAQRAAQDAAMTQDITTATDIETNI